MVVCQKLYPFEKAREMADIAIKKLEKSGLSIISPQEISFDIPSARRIARELWTKDIDLLTVFIGTWFEEPLIIAAIQEVKDLPLLVWGIPMYTEAGVKESTGSLPAAAIVRVTLEEMGRKFKFVVGLPSDTKTLDEVFRYAKTATTIKLLQRARIGLVGYASMGMYPATFDHVTLREQIGPEVVHIDTYSLIKKMDEISEEDALTEVQRFYKEYFVEPDVPQKDMVVGAKMYLGFKKLIEEFSLDSMVPKCQYELSVDYGAVCCVPLSILADEGVVCACEGDIHLAVTMMILNHLTGKPIFYGDVIDIREGNRLYLSSCGFAPLNLAAEPEKMGVGKHKYYFKGLRSGITMKPGRVTIARLEGRKGTYRMHIATGEALETELRQKYFPATEIALDGDVDDFIQNVLSQHYAVAQADIKRDLIELCSLLDVKVITT
jgi:L-fucose isomerase-like protein